MTTKSLPKPRFQQLKTLRALAIGLAIGFAAPVFADNLPEVQRLIKQGQYPQALEKVDAYLSSRPKDAQGRFLKGLIYTEMNKPAEAINIFTKLSEDYPELPEPYNNLAVLYAQQKQYDKARTALEMAIRTHPSYAIAYENLGDVYAKLASQAYDKALQLDNSNPATQNKLALIRDLITTSGKGNVKPPVPAPVAAAPVAAKPAPVAPPASAPTASVVTATPAVAANPPPAPAPSKADPASDDIAKAINAWASAWSRKDMKAYLGAYASDFNTPKGMSRKAWEAEREDRIAGKSGKISVSVDNQQISVNGDKATVKFRQSYKAGSLSSSASKTLILVRSGSKWLIKEENAR
ncbi:tetratricopeptide repeat protein [Dechloromonas denitrificans]|uniref:tetratricopeptide repeat protein n=1 Tax=Dechloromonas denitrificans TaxID=281362 RepID=UPI001CFB2FE8|nr:tetratricopeptide repeat protein [Dechloromonas denitrificans]UCV07146.1 tetratricopeptide repeat protein [Dechloromonas denitrificans]